MTAKIIKNNEVKMKIRTKKRKNSKSYIKDNAANNNNSIPLQVIQNKTELENIMKDYVVPENEKKSSKNKTPQRTIIKLEKVKARKENSLETKSVETEERTIFVGNVNITSSRDEVKKFFKKYGEIESVRFRGITPESEGISKKEAVAKKLLHPNRKSLNAYVRYIEKSSVDKAIKANGEIFNDYHIRVDRAIQSKEKDQNSVFVGNLPWEVNEEEVWELFGSCGKVTNVRLIRSATTGAGKGIGFVSFESDNGVQLALHLDGTKFMKREIRVVKSVKKGKNKGETKPAVKPGKKKSAANFSSKPKRGTKRMDVSFLKKDKPQILGENTKEKGRKRQKFNKSEENSKVPAFKGVKAEKEGKVIKKKSWKKRNLAAKKKFILAQKLASTS